MRSPPRFALERLHAHVSSEFNAIVAADPARFQCTRGCHDCCVDNLTVFEVEADLIRATYGDLLRTEEPHAPGACAFLDESGSCRIYEARPLVCRGHGVPLRWELEDGSGEARSVCPLNEEGTPLELLAETQCLELGPAEEVLAMMQEQYYGSGQRIPLRQLFSTASNGADSASLSTTIR